MNERLSVAESNGVYAVASAEGIRYVYEDGIPSVEHVARLFRQHIFSFAPRRMLEHWVDAKDPRCCGIIGTDEDLHALLVHREHSSGDFYVPFSHGPLVALLEFRHFRPTLNRFRMMFGEEAWTYRFPRELGIADVSP